MSAVYDQELCARLAKEARAAANSGLPGGSGLYGDSLAAMADQLEAARREVERLVDVIRDARSQVLDWSNTTMFTLARANLAVTLDDAIDAYRTAKGKT